MQTHYSKLNFMLPKKSLMLLVLIVQIFNCGCSLLSYKSPKIVDHTFVIQEITPMQTTLKCQLTIDNPNEHSINIKTISYKLTLNDANVIQDQLDQEIHLPPQQQTLTSFLIHLDNKKFLISLIDIFHEQKIRYQFNGNAKTNLFTTIHFSKEGTLSLHSKQDSIPRL